MAPAAFKIAKSTATAASKRKTRPEKKAAVAEAAEAKPAVAEGVVVLDGAASASAGAKRRGLKREALDTQGSSHSEKKACIFLCGSYCQQTPDPVDENRKCIRWAYDRRDQEQPCDFVADPTLK